MRRLALRWTTPALIAAVLLSSLKSTVAADDDADKADGTVAVFTISGEVTEKPGDEELAIFTG
ncbi:MAG: hypothetical protein O2945_18070, partial [Planctomycetota bacterium]|nr:hypothetical protein [Planctomycetota bacterium]